MRVHHLNCISTCPLGGSLMDAGPESILQRGQLTNHCLLIENNRELILVDTGFGLQDVRNPRSRISQFFLQMVKPEFREEMTAIRQIERLGFDPRDVRHILLTHLDFDHAGGLDDFPEAQVHMMQEEFDYASAQKTWLDRQRFRPQQWGTKANWRFYKSNEVQSWFGFDRVIEMAGVHSDIAVIPLRGHTFGHAGVAVHNGQKWLFNTGDAYFFHEEMNLVKPCCTPGLTMYQNMMDKDKRSRLWNQERLRNLKRAVPNEVEIFCAHDVKEFERLAGRPAGLAPEKIRGVRKVKRGEPPQPRP